MLLLADVCFPLEYPRAQPRRHLNQACIMPKPVCLMTTVCFWCDRAQGDVASIDRHGTMTITDRSKDVIKSGDQRVWRSCGTGIGSGTCMCSQPDQHSLRQTIGHQLRDLTRGLVGFGRSSAALDAAFIVALTAALLPSLRAGLTSTHTSVLCCQR